MGVKHILFLLMIFTPVASAIEIGGGFGIKVQVGNITDDDQQDDPDSISVEIYYHSYVTAYDVDNREENYAYTGEEINFEVYVQHDDEVEDLIIAVDDEEIECKKKNSKLDDGDDLEDFSDNIEYDEDFMDYYKCSFVMIESLKGTKDIEFRAMDDDIIGWVEEDWLFNPGLRVEVTKNSDNYRVENKKSVNLDIQNPCDAGLLDPDGDISVKDCGSYMVIAII